MMARVASVRGDSVPLAGSAVAALATEDLVPGRPARLIGSRSQASKHLSEPHAGVEHGDAVLYQVVRLAFVPSGNVPQA